MFAVIYRFRVVPGAAADFEVGWHRLTLAIRASCDAYGSRLHVAEDGTYVAYARWPSAEARAACWAAGSPDPEAARLMRAAITEEFAETQLTIVDDLLAEP